MRSLTNPSPTRFQRFTRLCLMAIATTGIAAFATGCSSGQITQTSSQVPAIQGVDAQVGNIAIRNAALAPTEKAAWPERSDVPLSIVLVNEGNAADTLLEVTSEQASSVQLATGEIGAEAEEQPSPSPSPTTSPSPTETASPTPTPTPTQEERNEDSSQPEEETPTPAGQPARTAIAANTLVNLSGAGENPQYLLLRNINSPIGTADEISVTFVFEKAGKITLRIPVAPPTEALSRTPIPGTGDHHGSGSEH